MTSLKQIGKKGDPDAIATLLQKVCPQQPIQIQATSKDNSLILLLKSLDKLPQDSTVKFIEDFFSQLQPENINDILIQNQVEGIDNFIWQIKINLNSSMANQETVTLEEIEGNQTEKITPQDHLLLPYYQQLNLELDATFEELQTSYFQIKAQIKSQTNTISNSQQLITLKEAYQTIKNHLQEKAIIESQIESQKTIDPITNLTQYLQDNDVKGKINLIKEKLQIYLDLESYPKSQPISQKIDTLLTKKQLNYFHLTMVETILIFGINSQEKISWRKTLDRQKLTEKEKMDGVIKVIENSAIFPILSILAILMNVIPIIQFLLRGINIWFHEFGHAIVAWLGGHKAIPLPFGWTNISEEKSLFVYFGVLCLLGLLFWKGKQEQKPWVMILAVCLVIIQFVMTWLISETTFYTLLYFGGIAGEFYICTLLMVSFFFSFPKYFNWEFYRFPVVFGAAFTFWNSLWFWWQIDQGEVSIPWGTLWGGENDAGGDMNQLVEFGWNDQQIINTYNFLGNSCFIIILATYFYFLFKNNRIFFSDLLQRFKS